MKYLKKNVCNYNYNNIEYSIISNVILILFINKSYNIFIKVQLENIKYYICMFNKLNNMKIK